MMKCFVGNRCLAPYPQDGTCYGKDEDADQTVTDMDQISGDWWVIGGVNCGQSEEWPGGYDNYPCQHERFIKPDGNQWINNVTFCAGNKDKCISDIIVTIANVSLPSPGVIQVDYNDAPLAPQVTPGVIQSVRHVLIPYLAFQIEHWRIISWPDHGDYMLVFWCGQLPILGNVTPDQLNTLAICTNMPYLQTTTGSLSFQGKRMDPKCLRNTRWNLEEWLKSLAWTMTKCV